jgi:hypothetical protein
MRLVDAIEQTAREGVAALSRKDALDVLDVARERLIQIASEHGGLTIGNSPEE